MSLCVQTCYVGTPKFCQAPPRLTLGVIEHCIRQSQRHSGHYFDTQLSDGFSFVPAALVSRRKSSSLGVGWQSTEEGELEGDLTGDFQAEEKEGGYLQGAELKVEEAELKAELKQEPIVIVDEDELKAESGGRAQGGAQAESVIAKLLREVGAKRELSEDADTVKREEVRGAVKREEVRGAVKHKVLRQSCWVASDPDAFV